MLTPLESRVVPSRPLPYPVIYTGAETGAPPTVKAFDADTGATLFERTVYEAAFTGGVRVATADFTGDAWPDLVVGPGAGGGPRVRVLDGKTGDPMPGPLGDFFAYEPTFTGGVEVAAADVTGDGWPDLIVTAGQGGGPRVRVFDGFTGGVRADFMAFDPDFRGGASVAATDLTGDRRADLIVGAGPGGGPHVKVFDLASQAAIPGPLGSFFAYEPTFTGGVHVGADWKAGDVDGDGRADLIVGPGAGRAPVVKVYSGRTGAQVREFAAFDAKMTAGVRAAAAYVTDDVYADVVVSTGPGVPDRVRVFDGQTAAPISGPVGDFAPFGGVRTGGVALAASNDPPGDIFIPGLSVNDVSLDPYSDGSTLTRDGGPDLSYSDVQPFRVKIFQETYTTLPVTLTVSISVGKLIWYHPTQEEFIVDQGPSFSAAYAPGAVAPQADIHRLLDGLVGISYPSGYSGLEVLTVTGAYWTIHPPISGQLPTQHTGTLNVAWNVTPFDNGEYWQYTYNPFLPTDSGAYHADPAYDAPTDDQLLGLDPLQVTGLFKWNTATRIRPYALPNGTKGLPDLAGDVYEVETRRGAKVLLWRCSEVSQSTNQSGNQFMCHGFTFG